MTDGFSEFLHRSLEDRIRFETLLADLSARFINMPADHVDAAIEDAQHKICSCLDLDISTLWLIDEEISGSMFMTHHHLPSESPPVPKVMNAQDVSPWCMEMLRKGETVVISRIGDAPAAAARDRELWLHYGIKSILTLPLSTGGESAFGALNFCAVRRERDWSPDLVNRLQLVAQIFANAQALLRNSEERLSLAVAAADAGLWVLNADRTCFWVNAKIIELFRLPPGNTLDVQHFLALLHAEDRKRVHDVMIRALDSTEMSVVEYRIVSSDGQVRWMQTRGRLCASLDGSPIRLMGITADITDRKRAGFESDELRRELAHVTRVSTMGELAASIAHELNQPLGAILRNAEAAELFLNDPSPDLDEVRAILADIRKDDQRAGKVIEQMRGLMKRREAELLILDAGQLAGETVALIMAEAELRHVHLMVENEPGLTSVLGDRVQLQQVLLNLLLNAIDASKENLPDERSVVVRIRAVSGNVEIAVTDRGHGISADSIDRIFEPFFTSKPDGLGMGLTISRSIIEAHGGRIRAANNAIGGATFIFTLPVAETDVAK